jgi:asparagine synthase (glutamine-hydrolysing)
LDVADRMKRYQSVFSIVSGAYIDLLFQDGLLAPGDGDTILQCWNDLTPLMKDTEELGGFQFLELRSSLPDELLMYSDKISMAHGLEVRVPYLDHELVEYVECLDASFKVRYGTRKWLHRRVAARQLPSEILKRKKKGFACNVVDEWFRASLSRRMNDIFLDRGSLIYRYVRQDFVQRLLSDHRSGKEDYHKLLFSLIVLEEFLQAYSSTPLAPPLDLPVSLPNETFA